MAAAPVKRPMNAFMVWSSEERRRVSALHPRMHNSEISRRLGEVWRALGDDERRPYRERAKRLRELHAREHPGYKYAPRKRKKAPSKSPGAPRPEGPDSGHQNIADLAPREPHCYLSHSGTPCADAALPAVSDVPALYGLGLYDFGERRGIQPQVHYQTVEVDGGGSLISL
ncbi:regulation of transcription from RNA polymerase II promoter involved in definitive endodermal cell fate specification [Pristimantis euphronides]